MPRRTKKTEPEARLRQSVTVTITERDAIRAAADDPKRWHFHQTQDASFEAIARLALGVLLGVPLPPLKRGAPLGNQNGLGNQGNKKATGRKKRRTDAG